MRPPGEDRGGAIGRRRIILWDRVAPQDPRPAAGRESRGPWRWRRQLRRKGPARLLQFRKADRKRLLPWPVRRAAPGLRKSPSGLLRGRLGWNRRAVSPLRPSKPGTLPNPARRSEVPLRAAGAQTAAKFFPDTSKVEVHPLGAQHGDRTATTLSRSRSFEAACQTRRG